MRINELTKLKVSPLCNGKKWKLVESWKLKVGKKQVTVRKGFVTDFASIPRFAWWFSAPATGLQRKPAVLHDWHYYKGKISRKEADTIFLKYMEQEGKSFIKRHIMYYAVRFFGKAYFNQHL